MLHLLGDTPNIKKLIACLESEFQGKLFLKVSADGKVLFQSVDGNSVMPNKEFIKSQKFDRRQKKVCKMLNEIISDDMIARAYVLSDVDNNKANFGGWRGFTANDKSFQCNTVNVNDAIYLQEKSDGVISASGFILHELYETFLDQARGVQNYDIAHRKALELQADVDGIFIHPRIGGHILDATNNGHIYLMIKDSTHKKITYKAVVNSMLLENVERLQGWKGPKVPGGSDEELL